jgi:DNA mismatch endonuclease (patch repair protein)
LHPDQRCLIERSDFGLKASSRLLVCSSRIAKPMGDIYSKAKRSEVMSRIRGRENKDTELALAKLLRRQGIKGWRRHQPVFGKPDFIFPKFRFALFVDGCFWHGCPKHATKPKNNRVFWRRKLSANKKRDQVVNRTLRRAGWRVVRIWECDLTRKNEARLERRILQFQNGS